MCYFKVWYFLIHKQTLFCLYIERAREMVDLSESDKFFLFSQKKKQNLLPLSLFHTEINLPLSGQISDEI